MTEEREELTYLSVIVACIYRSLRLPLGLPLGLVLEAEIGIVTVVFVLRLKSAIKSANLDFFKRILIMSEQRNEYSFRDNPNRRILVMILVSQSS